MRIKELHAANDPRLVLFAPLWHLIFQSSHHFIRMTEEHCDRHHQIKLCAALPHFHQTNFNRRASKKRPLWICRFKITANGKCLCQTSAIVQFKGRHLGHRADLAELRGLMLPFHDRNFLDRNLNPFFRKEYAYSPWIRRVFVIIQFH